MLACQDPTERAVSPVVGVMLMLVVTIIIAAIVTAFTGGITQTGDKTPQATLTGQFSQTPVSKWFTAAEIPLRRQISRSLSVKVITLATPGAILPRG